MKPMCLQIMLELVPSALGKFSYNISFNRLITLFFIRDVRESWIRAKYADKLFVRKLTDLTNPQRRSSRTSLMDVRKWSVRKLRRRTRSSDNSKKNKQQNLLNIKKLNDDSAIATTNTSNGSLLLFGSELEKQPLDESFDLSSDQDSTAGEDEEDHKLDEEDISKLHPDRLLYKAAAVHNLPVMCEAFALGADKDWINQDDLNRNAIHAAVLSVSSYLI